MADAPKPDESELRELWTARRFDVLTEAVLRRYGREIYEFLVALHRGASDAAEVFSMFAEGVWRGLERFEGACSFRTWSYAIARRSSLRHRRDARRRAARAMPFPEGSSLSIVVEQVRSETQSFLKTEKRSRIRELRDSLPDEDQALLMLRVDCNLAWNDLARVLHEADEAPLTEDGLKKEAARLRKRFQLVKEKLYELGRSEGLVGDRT